MDAGQLGLFPPNSSSRFGYILDIKVGKKQNPSIFLATYWNFP
jgi:hypothetical protein